MAMRQLGRNISVLSRTATRQLHPMTGSGASARRFFCSREQPPRDLPPRRDSIWAEIKEWTIEETFYVTFGTVAFSLGCLVCVDAAYIVKEIWSNGGLQSRDPPPSWAEDD